MDRLIAPQMQRKRKSLNFSKSGMIIPSPEMREKSRKVGKTASRSRFCPLERTDPNQYSRVDWQTLLAVRLVGAIPVDRDGIFTWGQLRWIPKRLRIAPAMILRGEHV
ncbi:hypothetical protein CRG98_006428 [Punica granatum]|uniref:Uncharacterized protein n=1 Tax=Punica granatum TaxID=22663 RepID=A0A2I0KXH9_PUNGR|nr:hypothetical protein CRG98_006428 [Punica granatum]